MTELEATLNDYEQIWSTLYPHHPFDSIRQKLAAFGLQAVIQDLRPETLRLRHGEISQRIQDAPDNANIAYPLTRPSSPHVLPLRLDFASGTGAEALSAEWREDDPPVETVSNTSPSSLPNSATTPGNDFGTGVTRGTGYLGLSSGSTLLHAIRKFAPDATLLARDSVSTFPTLRTSVAWQSNRYTQPGQSTAPVDQRGLPPTLPPAKEASYLLDAFFQYFHALTPLVHEPTIRAQVMGALPLPVGIGSQVLFNMIFATGAFDAATDGSSGHDGSQYYELARAALQQDLLEGGSVLLVQGLAVMAIYLQRNNKPNAGYICLGFAIRMAMALGIHIACQPAEGSTVHDVETRCRLWWCLVTLETGQSMTYGRPHSISLATLLTQKLPANTHDFNLTVSSTELPSDDNGVTVYTALIIQSILSQTVLPSYDRISRSRPSPTVEQIKWAGDNFQAKIAHLPSYTQAASHGPCILACAVQRWRAREYRAILYRPVLLSAASDKTRSIASDQIVQGIIKYKVPLQRNTLTSLTYLRTSRDLAIENLQDIANFVRSYPDPHRGNEWCVLYFAVQASLPILLSLVWEPNHADALSWRSLLEELCSWLRQLQSMYELGSSYADILANALAYPEAEHAQPVESDGNVSQQGNNPEEPPFDPEMFDFDRFFSEIWTFPGSEVMGFEPHT